MLVMKNLDFDWSQYDGMPLNQVAAEYGTEIRDDETDAELRRRIVSRFIRFTNNNGSFYDLVHAAEQAITSMSPIACDFVSIRRQVGLGLIAKNKPGNWWVRLKTAIKAFWACL